MPLRWIEVENYRAIANGRVTFDDTTVLFGENDSGRTSIIEALVLVLSGAGHAMEEALRPVHFHRRGEGDVGTIHIRLEVEEDAPGRWRLPEALAVPNDGAVRRLVFDFEAHLDPGTGSIRFGHTVTAPGSGVVVDGGSETKDWLRDVFPILWLQPGHLTGLPESAAYQHPPSELSEDPDLAALDRHHRNILTGNSTDMARELEAGAEAARRALERYSHIFGGGAPMMGSMVAEILGPRLPSSRADLAPAWTGARKIAVLLLLGAMLQLARQALEGRSLPEEATPILLIENPEVNLHPITLASVWRTVSGITWQKIIATQSEVVLGDAPLASLRRLTRHGGMVREWAVAPDALTGEALRKVSYHLRSRRASAMFARCWLLIEGETEYWVIPELARLCGYDFAEEGVSCVEFAQSGVAPLAALADQLGIGWRVVVDGDEAGMHYADAVRAMKSVSRDHAPVTMLSEPDIEHSFWSSGFADVIRSVAKVPERARDRPSWVIHKAIERTSKPYLALALIDAAVARGPDSVPPVLRQVIEESVALARR